MAVQASPVVSVVASEGVWVWAGAWVVVWVWAVAWVVDSVAVVVVVTGLPWAVVAAWPWVVVALEAHVLASSRTGSALTAGTKTSAGERLATVVR